MDQIKAALRKLSTLRAVDTLLELNEVRKNPALAQSPDYQRRFIGYYRMGRKNAQFYRAFFSILRDAASAVETPSLAMILRSIFDKTGERHLSFGSKLRSTVTDEVIFDRNVAAYAEVSSTPLPEQNWLTEALRRHAQVRQKIHQFIQSPNWPQIRALFDQAFPNAAHLSDNRKADLIIWALYDP